MSDFARRHYERIAGAINAEHLEAQRVRDAGAQRALEALTNRLATAFAADNPAFNRATFMHACGFYD